MKWKINTIVGGVPVRKGEVVDENDKNLAYVKAHPDSVEKTYKRKKVEGGED